MGIPVAVGDLHEAHAGLAKAAGHETLFAEGFGGVGVSAVEFFDVRWLAGDVLHAGHFHLHFESEFVGGDTRFQFAVRASLGKVFFIEGCEEIQFFALFGLVVKRVVDEGDFHFRPFSADVGTVIFSR